MIRLGGLELHSGRAAIAVPFFRALPEERLRALRGDGMEVAEIRLDLAGVADAASAAELIRAFAKAGVPLIATARVESEGGKWGGKRGGGGGGDESLRRDVLLAALEFADAADIELSAAGILPEVVSAARRLGKLAVISRHNFAGTDSRARMESALRAARDSGADIFKMACAVSDESDSQRMLEFLRANRDGFPLIATAMGEGDSARNARLALARSGSVLAFAAADGPSAPGQMTLAETVAALRG